MLVDRLLLLVIGVLLAGVENVYGHVSSGGTPACILWLGFLTLMQVWC